MRCLLVALLLLPTFCAAADQWTEIKSPHFTVITDAGEKRGREVAKRFEQMRQVFGTLVLHKEVSTSRPVQILAFKNTKGLRMVSPTFKGKTVDDAGLYRKGPFEDYIGIDLSSEGDYKWQTVFHEYAHLLLNSNTFAWPAWFDEGFAELFSTFDLSGREALIGRSPEYVARMLASNRLVPVAKIFAVQHDSATYNESGDRRDMFYAESWLIVHYAEDKQLVKPLLEYFAMTHGHADEAQFQKLVGMSFSDFDRALERYESRGRLMGWRTPLPSGIEDNQFIARPLSANDGAIAVAEMQVNGRDLRDLGIASLQQALAADPNNEKAETDLGSAFLMNDDLLHAEPYLEKAVAGGSSDPMAHYYYALLLQLQFQSGTPKPEQLERQQKELEETIKLDPSLAAAYNLLSTNARERKDFDAAIRASMRAVTLNPREQTYALNLANACLAAQKVPEAQAVIDRLRDSTNPHVLSELASMQSYITQWQNEHRDEQDRNNTSPQNVRVAAAASATRSVPETGSPSAKEAFPKTLDTVLVQVDCKPDGSGSLSLKEGTGLLQVPFRSFSSVVDSDSGTLTCWTKNRHVSAEFAADGTLKKISAVE